MSQSQDTCKEPDCKSPIVGDDGWCVAHRDDGEEIRRRAKKGGKMRQYGGMDPDEVPEITDYDSAMKNISITARAVQFDKMKPKRAHAVIRAVEAFIKVLGEKITKKRLDKIKEEQKKLKDKVEKKADKKPWED